MQTVKNVLLLFDFSECAKQILDRAVDFSRQLSANLFVLHVVHDPYHWYESYIPDGDLESMKKEMIESAEKRIEIINESVSKEGLSVQTFVQIGHLVEDAGRFVEEHQIDLIAMGTHGRKGMEKMFFGSNADKIVRSANVPVLVMRPHFDAEHHYVV